MARKTPLAVLLVVSSPIKQAWTCWLLVVCWHGTSESQTFFQQYACNNGHHPALVLVPRKICISCFTLVAPHCVALFPAVCVQQRTSPGTGSGAPKNLHFLLHTCGPPLCCISMSSCRQLLRFRGHNPSKLA